MDLSNVLSVLNILHLLWYIETRKPSHRRTKEKASFLGDVVPVKLTVTITSGHWLQTIPRGCSLGFSVSADELNPQKTQPQDESGLSLLSSEVPPYQNCVILPAGRCLRPGNWHVRHLGMPGNCFSRLSWHEFRGQAGCRRTAAGEHTAGPAQQSSHALGNAFPLMPKL